MQPEYDNYLWNMLDKPTLNHKPIVHYGFDQMLYLKSESAE